MAQKNLNVKIKLDSKAAEASLSRLSRKINDVQKAISKTSTSNNKLTTAINKAVTSTNKLDKATQKVATTTEKVVRTTNKVNTANNQAANSARKMSSSYNASNTAAGNLLRTLKSVAATYLGIMGTRAVINASDNITSTENRLNNMPGGNEKLTQESMDKIYSAAQSSRSNYSAMLSNVSKTMTLAGGAFHGEIDNAIRFQEIMAKAYAVGGASAAEQSSSMYQLTQALGSGVLQGDELRSLREGAPLAYKAIEEFAQGVLKTDESLKDLASQGAITSEMVVAAIMDMGDGIDATFAKTKQTFGQTFDQISNAAVYAFKPVLQKLNDTLNKLVDAGLIQSFETLFTNLAKAILIVFELIEIGINWMADNWYWLQYVVYGVITALIISLGLLLAKVIATAVTSFLAFLFNNPFSIWIVTIALLVAALVWLLNKCTNFCDFIIQIAMIVAQAIILILGVVLAVYLATGTTMMSIPALIALTIIGILAVLIGAFVQWTGEIVGFAYGLKEAVCAVFTNIGLFFQNTLKGMQHLFWKFIDSVIQDFKPLIEMANSVLEALDKPTIDVNFAAKKSKALANEIGYVSVSDAFSKGYSEGYVIGENIQSNINSFGERIKKFLNDPFGEENKKEKDKTSLLDEIGNKLGLDFSGMGNFPSGSSGGSYAPDYEKLLGGINDNTGQMADSMELTQEDLAFLRKIADTEWKKEFTTAEIKVEMNNTNTINGESDLDGIVTKLTDKLYEELNSVANGVHA